MNLHFFIKHTVVLAVFLYTASLCADALDRNAWTLSASSNAAQLNNAIDNSISTRWDSATPQSPGQYIQIDFGQQETIDAIELSNEGSDQDYFRGYAVYTSNNGNFEGNPIATGEGSGDTTSINFAPTTARYLRIEQTGTDDFFWLSIHDIQVNESDISVTESLNRSTWSLSGSTNSADLNNAIDGNTGSRWTTTQQTQEPGQYFQIDLGSSTSFDNIVIDSAASPNDEPASYAVFTSNNANNFGSPITSGSGASSGVTNIEFNSTNARYIRIEQQGSKPANWWSIHEINIYSTSGEVPIEVPVTPIAPTGDECNSTQQCKNIYGSIADDCRDSQSNNSVCYCGAEACYLSVGGFPTPTPLPTVVATPVPVTTPAPVPTAAPTSNPIEITGDCNVSGELRQWHRVELLCEGPNASETNDETFTDFRFDVTFSRGNESITVPGHFAADGQAADTNANSGNQWRAYFSPPNTGTWNYTVSFRSGNNVAISDANGTSVSGIDNAGGSFNVAASNASGRDMRARGLLQHRSGERYLRHAGDDSIFIQGGMDSPENIFGYSEFDNTTKQDDAGSCKGILHDFDPHEDDWNSGDPTWDGGKGRSLIGLVNYIAERGVNSVYIMMNTVSSDGCDAHPWVTYNSSGNEKAFDVSKLDQWERVLSHMTEKGLMIHAMTQETENDQLLNNGNLGDERRLYYRELISRFAHHPALQWNLGEENSNTTNQRRDYSDYIKATDPYDHPIKMHTYPNDYDEYEGLLGHSTFDGATIQVSSISENENADGNGVYGLATEWLERSGDDGVQWVVTFTEASGGQAPTPNEDVTDRQRIYWMWASVMSGGGGFEWYLKNDGSGHAYDLAVENLREFDQHWEQSGYLARFFRDTLQGEYGIDLQNMQQNNNVTSTDSDWVLSDSGEAYLIYLREGGTTNINLPNNATYRALWFNPRTGQQTDGGTFVGPGNRSIGNPPSQTNSDWAVLITQ